MLILTKSLFFSSVFLRTATRWCKIGPSDTGQHSLQIHDTFDEIWCSEKRLDHADFVMNELDINECRVNCRMDQVNRYLDGIVNKKVEHFNFV